MSESGKVVIETWTDKHSKILILTAEGKSVKEIAEAVGMHKNSITAIRSTANFKNRLEKYNERVLTKTADKTADVILDSKVRKMLREAAPDAVKALIEFITRPESDNIRYEFIRLNAAKDLLNRCGYEFFLTGQSQERAYSPEETESMKKAVSEMEQIMTRLNNNQSSYVLNPKNSGGERTRIVAIERTSAPSSPDTDNGSFSTSSDRPDT